MSLHNEIMNIECDKNHMKDYPELRLHYKQGHRDARHAAAELALKADADALALIEQLNSALTRIASHVGATCCGVDVDIDDSGHTATAIIAGIDAMVAREREACAKECEREMMFEGGRQESFAHHGVQEAAKAIRTRTSEGKS